MALAWACTAGSWSSPSRCCTHWFRRLRIRWEVRDDIHEAFLSLACAITCWSGLANASLLRSSQTLFRSLPLAVGASAHPPRLQVLQRHPSRSPRDPGAGLAPNCMATLLAS